MPQQETATVDPQVSVPRQAPTTFCQQHGVRRVAVFGSTLRRDAGPGRDIDLIVEFEPARIPALPPVAGIELTLLCTLRAAQSRPAPSRRSQSPLPPARSAQGRSPICAAMTKSACAPCSKPRAKRANRLSGA